MKDGFKPGHLVIKKDDFKIMTAIACPFTYFILCFWVAEYPKEPYMIELEKIALNSSEPLKRSDTEKYIARNIVWKIESEPQGGAINYRIKSHTNEVSSTSSMYLERTPYEGVRRFDIKGLNYENMKHITIVVEVRAHSKITSEFISHDLLEVTRCFFHDALHTSFSFLNRSKTPDTALSVFLGRIV